VLSNAAQTGFKERPTSRVLLLFLSPNYLNIFLEFLQFSSEGVEGERRELLDADDSDVFATEFVTLRNQVVVDLAGAKNNFLALVGACDAVFKHTSEFSAWQELTHVG